MVRGPAEPEPASALQYAVRRALGVVLAASFAARAAPSRAQQEATVRGSRGEAERSGRAGAAVTREEMDERIARSAPDALRWVPGVTVQQTAHGQASPFVRGLTGQQVLLLFDGVRLNNGIFRQGPNQYFFTVDAQSVERIDVVRGSASVRYGADALGGAVIARPVEPTFAPGVRALAVRATGFARFESAALEPGGRVEVEAQVRDRVAIVGGFGYRVAGELRGGAGGVRDLRGGRPAYVPRLEADGATQHGTGFTELTFDARAVVRLRPRLELVAALYGYRQFDAPRTDQCPAPDASPDSCLTVSEQFRTLAYATLRGDPSAGLRDVQVTFAWQRFHEQRRLELPQSFIETGGTDDLDTFGVTARAATPRVDFGRNGLRALYGVDVWRDGVRSEATSAFTLTSLRFTNDRGLYMDGGTFFQGGGFAELELALGTWLVARAGARGGFAGVHSPGQASSMTAAVDRGWRAVVARGGLELRPHPALAILASVDQGFRPPNLDDLSARGYAAGGFVFENPALEPERSVSYELGARVRSRAIDLDASGFFTVLDGAMTRTLRTLAQCPPSDAQCAGYSTRLQLVNSPAPSYLAGFEAALRVRLPLGLSAAATVAYAWGEGPNPLDPSARVPLSRMPPLQGTVEARWGHASGFYVGAALRWATDQTRLSIGDQRDPRIPLGGTPGYAVADLRVGFRPRRWARVHAVFENITDAAWRVHGSSINGPGRGLLVQAAIGW
jgi:iron complex outermembrane receptor protein/hemoglobin/transferrin/lactoferrin receptor protein